MLSEFHDEGPCQSFDPGQYVCRNLPYNYGVHRLFGEGVIAAERLLIHHGLKRIALVKAEGFERPLVRTCAERGCRLRHEAEFWGWGRRTP
jgi:hypothetical protein